MKVVIALLACVAVAQAGVIAAPATYISRAPAFDSAIIKSDRLGGNFAYSTAETHAYAAHAPIVQTIATPVITSYAAPAIATYAAAPALTYGAYPHASVYGTHLL